MITTEEEHAITLGQAAEFAERMTRLEARGGQTTRDRVRVAAARAVLEGLQRDLALWEAGIREPVPGVATVIDPPDLVDEPAGVLSDEERRAGSRLAAIAQKRGEIANIDRQIGILLDRIADWRRHRAWLEREIAGLEAHTLDPEPAVSRG